MKTKSGKGSLKVVVLAIVICSAAACTSLTQAKDNTAVTGAVKKTSSKPIINRNDMVPWFLLQDDSCTTGTVGSVTNLPEQASCSTGIVEKVESRPATKLQEATQVVIQKDACLEKIATEEKH